MPRRRSSKKPSHTFITSNKGKNLLVIDDYIYNHTKISSNVRTFIKTLKKEEVVSRQLMLKSSSGNQKRKTKAILALEVRLKILSTRFENYEIDRKQYLEGLSLFVANKKLTLIFYQSMSVSLCILFIIQSLVNQSFI
jgi:hypothetical protein